MSESRHARGARSSGASHAIGVARASITRLAPLLLALAPVIGTCGTADGPVPATAPATQASDAALTYELEALQAKLGDVHDLSTHFTQEKHTALLRKPLLSSGTVCMAGDLMRWDTLKPAASVMLIGKSEIRLYYPEQKLLEVYPLDQQLARMAASPVPRLSLMREYFDLAPAPAASQFADVLSVELRPKQTSLREHVDKVMLLIDRKSGYLKQMTMVDGDGDTTTTRFEDVRIDTGLSTRDLELRLPADVRISHPMSGEGAAHQ